MWLIYHILLLSQRFFFGNLAPPVIIVRIKHIRLQMRVVLVAVTVLYVQGWTLLLDNVTDDRYFSDSVSQSPIVIS